MTAYQLVLERAKETSERYRISAQGLRIGRGPGNDVRLPDGYVSHRHARVWVENGVVNIEDLGSRNGLKVNGKQADRSSLAQGDIVTIGEATFHVLECSESALGRSVISPEHAEALHEKIMGEASGIRLPVLYRATQLLGTVFDVDELLRKLLGLVFEALPVRRGFVLILPEDGGAPEIHAMRSLEEDEGPPLSHTLIQHVFDHREAMLTVDAQSDSRFDRAESIMGHEIHAAMCAPLCGREAVIGAVYVDSGSVAHPFDTEELELLTAISQVVGVAVENARLYRENVQRERLVALGQATAGLGHCVKNILTGIRGAGEFIDMALRKQDLEYLEKGWAIMSRSIDRIDMLVMNMLLFSKERQPERMVTDINMLIRDAIEVLGKRAEKSNVAIEFEADADGRADLDAQQIFRVILNLITNAVEACEGNGGTVTVRSSYDEDGCRIEVADTGVGIPEDILPRISEAFVSTKGSAGTGLGLACSYKIVHEHGGLIEAGNNEGGGATFNVFLPKQAWVSVPTQSNVAKESDAES